MLKLLSPAAILLVLVEIVSPAFAEAPKPSVAKRVGTAVAKKAASIFSKNGRVSCHSNSDYLVVTETRDDGFERILVRKAVLSAKKPLCVFQTGPEDWVLDEPAPAGLNVVALSGHSLALKIFDPNDIHLPRVQILDLKERKVAQEIPGIFEMDMSDVSPSGFVFWRDTGLPVTRDNCPEYADQAEDEDSAIGVPRVLRKSTFSFASQKITEATETWCLLDVD